MKKFIKPIGYVKSYLKSDKVDFCFESPNPDVSNSFCKSLIFFFCFLGDTRQRERHAENLELIRRQLTRK